MSEQVKHTPTPYEYSDRNWRGEVDEWSFYIHGDIHESVPDEDTPDDEDPGMSAVSVAIVPGNPTGRDVAEATAKFLCKAANCHERLLAACKARLAADDHFRTCDKCGADLNGNVWYCGVRNQLADHAAMLMCDAVAKAEGQSQ